MTNGHLPKALDEKNAADFAELTLRIQSALEKIRQTPKLKASQSVLATLANCSRGTLNNRKWPIDELQAIKGQRKKLQTTASIIIPAVEQEETRLEQLSNQLYKSREQLRIWKNRCDEKVTQLRQLDELNTVLQHRIVRLEGELAKFQQPQTGKVINLQSPK